MTDEDEKDKIKEKVHEYHEQRMEALSEEVVNSESDDNPLHQGLQDPLPSLKQMFEMDPYELDGAFFFSYFVHAADKSWPTWNFRFQTVAKFKKGLHKLYSSVFPSSYKYNFQEVSDILDRIGSIDDYFEDKMDAIDGTEIRKPGEFPVERIKEILEEK